MPKKSCKNGAKWPKSKSSLILQWRKCVRGRIRGRGPKLYNCVNVSVTWTQDVLQGIRGRSHKGLQRRKCGRWRISTNVAEVPSSTTAKTCHWTQDVLQWKLREIVTQVTSQVECISTKFVWKCYTLVRSLFSNKSYVKMFSNCLWFQRINVGNVSNRHTSLKTVRKTPPSPSYAFVFIEVIYGMGPIWMFLKEVDLAPTVTNVKNYVKSPSKHFCALKSACTPTPWWCSSGLFRTLNSFTKSEGKSGSSESK